MPTLSRPMFKRNPKGARPTTAHQKDIAHDYRRELGHWLCDLRLEANLTQADVAKVLGVANTAISAIETGRGSVPPERYEALADVLNVDREEFGKQMLRYSNPWAYALIFGADKTLKKELNDLSDRIGVRVGPRKAGE